MLGAILGLLVYCVTMIFLFAFDVLKPGLTVHNEPVLALVSVTFATLAGYFFGALLDMKGKWKQLDEEHREFLYRIKTVHQCFNLQEAIDQRLTEVAIRWHEHSQKFVEKGTDIAINQQVETFNKLYSMIEDTFGDNTLLREKDIRSYLPEELKQAS